MEEECLHMTTVFVQEKKAQHFPLGSYLFCSTESDLFRDNEEQCAGRTVLGFDFCIKCEGNGTTLAVNESIVVPLKSGQHCLLLEKLTQLNSHACPYCVSVFWSLVQLRNMLRFPNMLM